MDPDDLQQIFVLFFTLPDDDDIHNKLQMFLL